jgi:hypothetical protein
VNRPALIGAGARTATAQQRGVLLQVLRLDEQLGEGGMCEVIRERRQGHLGITRHFEFTNARPAVVNGHAPDFDIVFG